MNKVLAGALTGFLGSLSFLYFLIIFGTLLGIEDLTVNAWKLIVENKLFVWLCTTTSAFLFIFFVGDEEENSQNDNNATGEKEVK